MIWTPAGTHRKVKDVIAASEFGALIADCRRQRGTSLEDLSKVTGISVAHLSRVESGERGISAARALNLANVVGLPPERWIPTFIEREVRVATLCDLCATLLETGQTKWASASIERARRLNRKHFKGRYTRQISELYGRICYQQGRFARAVVAYQHAAEGLAHRKDPCDRAKLLYNLGLSLSLVGRPFEAIAKLERAERIFRQEHRHLELAHVLLAHANILTRAANRFHSAERLYRKAAHLSRGHLLHFEALLGVAICRWRQFGGVAGLSEFRALVSKAAPGQLIKVHHNSAVVLRQMGRYREALAETEEALKDTPASPDGVFATLCEQALCAFLIRDLSLARRVVVKAHDVSGQGDDQDEMAFSVMSRFLGNSLEFRPVPRVRDDYEGRLAAVITVTSTLRRWQTSQEDSLSPMANDLN